MTPHALLPDSRSPSTRSSSVGSRHAGTTEPEQSPFLRHVPEDELHDLVCVGFGPASLAIAVALHDSFEHANGGAANASALPKVAFLERQPEFAWHAGMQIPGAKMQISFLKDFATLRNPRSEFTFLNYLHRNNRLVQFTNVSTFLPRRLEYEDYMRWCASHFNSVVSYGQEVLSVVPESTTSGKPTKSFTVSTRNIKTGEITSLRSKHVLVGVGGRPKIPQNLPQQHPRIVHSSKYQAYLRSTDLDPSAPLRIAVVGGGQSAAEIFADLPSRFPNSRSWLLIKGTALRPSDDSPFVNEVFDPDRVDLVYGTPAERRAANLIADKATNYGVVRLNLLEHIYEDLYTQRITHGNDESTWPRNIVPNTAIESLGEGTLVDPLSLNLRSTDQYQKESHLNVDLMFVASGYERDMHEEILKDCRPLLPEGAEKFDVQRDYSVRFAEGKVGADAGVWLQGCNEKTHGLSDTLLSILSIRGGEIVNSVFGR
ncbi:L-ornithine N5-oxygenase sida [Myriangium duriaei CBS 260.36]|uniref:L-ornithine N(5)-monooxygenase [NAD(P)H] n=1 Tax=Myriangium duriaei CBS 260.36 TaxID=1168546 RepID=A0A9P4J5V6_9PEZI|nr:L-ornithine N5-oxygenase sida [Myriangium duriaei CBS 260.36]